MTRNKKDLAADDQPQAAPEVRAAMKPGVRYHLARMEDRILIRSEDGEQVIPCASEEEAKNALR